MGPARGPLFGTPFATRPWALTPCVIGPAHNAPRRAPDSVRGPARRCRTPLVGCWRGPGAVPGLAQGPPGPALEGGDDWMMTLRRTASQIRVTLRQLPGARADARHLVAFLQLGIRDVGYGAGRGASNAPQAAYAPWGWWAMPDTS
jgi:hypothetical protein